MPLNGHGYTSSSSSTTYALDGNGGVAATTTPTTYSGGGRSFTVDANGLISGDETGYQVNGSMYVNSSPTRCGAVEHRSRHLAQQRASRSVCLRR